MNKTLISLVLAAAGLLSATAFMKFSTAAEAVFAGCTASAP